MLRSLKSLKGFHVKSTDSGDNSVGKVKDIYFDDQKWVARYLVVDTGGWFVGNQTLISPYSVSGVGRDQEIVWINLTREQIENSPLAESQDPVSRQFENEYNEYYGFPNYWSATEGLWMGGVYPRAYIPDPMYVPGSAASRARAHMSLNEDVGVFKRKLEKKNHLRSINEVIGYHLQNHQEEDFGVVEDLILEEDSWAIRYLGINTKLAFAGAKRLLISPDWVSQIRWESGKFFLEVDRHTLENCPTWDPDLPITRDIEERLALHFDKPNYWTQPMPHRGREQQT